MTVHLILMQCVVYVTPVRGSEMPAKFFVCKPHKRRRGSDVSMKIELR